MDGDIDLEFKSHTHLYQKFKSNHVNNKIKVYVFSSSKEGT